MFSTLFICLNKKPTRPTYCRPSVYLFFVEISLINGYTVTKEPIGLKFGLNIDSGAMHL